MPVLAFDMTPADPESRRFEFRGKNNADYFSGDLQPLQGGDVDMRIEKSVAGDYSIYQLTSRSGLAFRRSWSHIRDDRTDVTLVWFLRRGRITLVHPGGRYTVGPRQCAVTRSSRPFYMELNPEDGAIEAMHVVVPSHKLYALVGETLEVGRALPTLGGDLSLAERIVTMLFEEDDQIDAEVAEQLVQALLNGLGKTIARTGGRPAPRSSITDRRVADVTRFIGQHFANPGLNARLVANGCGISLRYLCYVLKRNGLSFSRLVWSARIEAAHGWLAADRMRHHTICEIAYLAGFKSGAHFSRAFKTRYGIVPRAFRLSARADGGAAADAAPAMPAADGAYPPPPAGGARAAPGPPPEPQRRAVERAMI